MKPFISTKFYGYFNYLLAALFIASPWLFGFYNVSSAAVLLPIYMGWLQLIMAVFANNEGGFIKQLPMQMHLVVDVFMGFLLMVSPWLWAYAYIGAHQEFLPQLLMGMGLFFLGIFTKKSPFTTAPHHALPQGEMASTDSIEGRLSI